MTEQCFLTNSFLINIQVPELHPKRTESESVKEQLGNLCF